MAVIREPLAVLFGVLSFACAWGACWQAGLAWPGGAARPLSRVAAALAAILGAFGFSLGYWEALSGIGDLVYRFDAPLTRFLFDAAAIGLPVSVAGLLLGVASTLHAADVPPRAIIPALVAGYAIGWLLDPYGTLGSARMDAVRARYVTTRPGSAWNSFGGSGDGGGHGAGHGGSGGGGGGFDMGDGEGGGIILLIALAVLAIAGGVITAVLVFRQGRRKAKAQLEPFRPRPAYAY